MSRGRTASTRTLKSRSCAPERENCRERCKRTEMLARVEECDGQRWRFASRMDHCKRPTASVVRRTSLYFDCHSGPDLESSLAWLDSRLRENDGSGMSVKKRWTHLPGRGCIANELPPRLR